MMQDINPQFFIGLFIGAGLTFVYVARVAIGFYHPIIREQQARIATGENAETSTDD